ncbi:cytoplasmic tRNA 2-thiolation protein 1 [Lathamus discolor]|uniref:cytoplasmic tRNA 2-thiolation protein 1 n=1 Tax=Lathamus discolor TaxID=678569 RepID=UPI0032B7B3F2
MPPPRCQLCPLPAALLRPRCGTPLCRHCFMLRFEAELLGSITRAPGARGPVPAPGSTVAVAASGGKDSTVLSHLLQRFAPRLHLRLALVSVDEGIAGYREAALEAVREGRGGAPLLVLSHRDLFGWSVDEVAAALGAGSRCTFCGVLRRQALERAARLLGANCIATGHNADDIAETLLMNFLRGDVARLRRAAWEGGAGPTEGPMESPTEGPIESPMESPTEGPIETGRRTKTPMGSTKDPMKTSKDPIETSRSSIGVPVGSPTAPSPIETSKDPMGTTKDPMDTTKDPMDTSKGPMGTTKDPMKTPKDPMKTPKDPTDTSKDPIETSRSSIGVPVGSPTAPSPIETSKDPMGTTKDPMDTSKGPMGTTKDPMKTPKDPMKTPKDPTDTSKDPIETSRSSIGVPVRSPTAPSPIETSKDPIETCKGPMGTSRDPMKTPKDPMKTPKGPTDTPKDPMGALLSLMGLPPSSGPTEATPGRAKAPRKAPPRPAAVPAALPARGRPWAPVPRCKPLRHACEKEIVLYAHFRRLRYVSAECAHAARAFRGHARALLKALEAARAAAVPALGHSGRRLRVGGAGGGGAWRELRACARCGFAASRGLCQACVLQGALQRGRPRLALGKRGLEEVMGEGGARGHGAGVRGAVDPRAGVEVEVVGAGGRSLRRRVVGLGRARGALNIWDF